MDQFDRTELKMILEGLVLVRDRLERDNRWVFRRSDAEDSEHARLVRLQDRIIADMDSRFY